MPHPLLRLAPLFRGRLGLLTASILGLIAATGLNLAGPWLLATAIDEDLARGDREGLVVKAALFTAVLAGNLGLTYAARVGIEICAQRAMKGLKRLLFDHLVEHDLAFHDQHTSGRLITRVQGDTDALRVLFAEVLLALPADVLLFVGMFSVMAVSAPEIAPLCAAVLPFYLLLFALFRKVAPPYFLALRKVRSTLTGLLTELVRAMPTLRGFRREQWARDRSEALNEEVFHKEFKSHMQGIWYFNSVVLVRSLGMVVLLAVGAWKVDQGTLTIGALVMGLGYLRQMFHPLIRLSHHLSTLERARAAAIRVSDILDTPRNITDPEEAVPWPGVELGMQLDEVRFEYVEGTPVLRGLSLDIPAGLHVGIVGATGAGKSTVLNLLLRFRDPTAGSVRIDGVDLRDLAVEDLRQRIGLVLQDVHLFAGSVLDNLGGDQDRARRALDTLGIDMPLHHELRDGGSNLSRGERQLLTFARAIVDDPEILVLDEATSAVDPETEALVQGALSRLMAGRTVVTVAHRLATVRACDTIAVLRAGVVEELGTHDELIDAGGLYAALHQLQAAA
ncbi:MAG TPA: ABC transporter ATP-binding protein [Myxococcota bacterium]|nr:ABC transporter ATP-binding protein [Myxococcota bacterium]